MSLSLIRPLRLTAVGRVTKPDISIITLLQIVAALVCPFVFFLVEVILVNGEHRIGIYACTCKIFLHCIHNKKQDCDSKYQFVPVTKTKILEDEEQLFIDYGSELFPINKKEEGDSVILPSTCCC